MARTKSHVSDTLLKAHARGRRASQRGDIEGARLVALSVRKIKRRNFAKREDRPDTLRVRMLPARAEVDRDAGWRLVDASLTYNA